MFSQTCSVCRYIGSEDVVRKALGTEIFYCSTCYIAHVRKRKEAAKINDDPDRLRERIIALERDLVKAN